MELPTAYLRGLHATDREILSARPDAPVVPFVERTPRLRTAVARALYRASAAVAPRGRRPEAIAAGHRSRRAVQPAGSALLQ
jgi:hypothetical protein